MAEYLTPGVYVEEFDSGAPPMASISTSIVGFIGVTEKGPQSGVPVFIDSFASFFRIFGGYLSENEFGAYRYLPYAVNQFFVNGGSKCYVKRVVPSNAKYACNTEDTENAPFVVYAANPGVWGNKIAVRVTPSSKARTNALEKIDAADGNHKYRVKSAAGFLPGDIVAASGESAPQYNKVTAVDENVLTFAEAFTEDIVDSAVVPKRLLSTCEIDLEVRYDIQTETFETCSFNPDSPHFLCDKLAKSELILCEVKAGSEILPPYQLISGKEDGEFSFGLFGGFNGTKDVLSSNDFIGEDKGPGQRTGIQAFIDNNEVSLMTAPGMTDPAISLALIAHCENTGSRFAVLDMPRDLKSVTEIVDYRNIFDSQYAAMYHPWVKVFDPLTSNAIAIPPSGSAVGIYARTDNTRGVHKAPANEIVSACVGLDCNYTNGEQDILNPKGVNLIRSFPGRGIRVWGARTLSSNSLWRYINVRRLFIFVEETIRASTNWVVFEPNDAFLWLRVKQSLESFLTDVWRGGALMGATASEAFFVDIGPTTMTQSDIDNGRLICVIGIAPVKPAEFVIFRITQKTGNAQ